MESPGTKIHAKVPQPDAAMLRLERLMATGAESIPHGSKDRERWKRNRADLLERQAAAASGLSERMRTIAFDEILNKLLNAARTRSLVAGKAFDLTLEFLAGRAAEQKYRCALSGLDFSMARGRNPFKVSIDRIDSRKGYTKDNVRLVSLIANMALSDWGDEPLRIFCDGFIRRARQ